MLIKIKEIKARRWELMEGWRKHLQDEEVKEEEEEEEVVEEEEKEVVEEEEEEVEEEEKEEVELKRAWEELRGRRGVSGSTVVC